jgi:putative glutamine amidotransferase
VLDILWTLTATPLIAVIAPRLAPGRVSGWPGAAEAVQSEYLDGLRRAGAVAVGLGAIPTVDAPSYLRRFDGLMLVGGPDVDPSHYGEAAHPAVYGLDACRDETEIVLSRAALAIGLPLFGICRGIQLLNVALGGTLWQHVADLDLPVSHGVPAGSGAAARHRVDVAPGSRLASLVGATRVDGCVSIHHQALRDLAPGLVPTAWSPDGLIEGVETRPDGPWCVAVQWHPERSAAEEPLQQALFDGFVAEAAR